MNAFLEKLAAANSWLNNIVWGEPMMLLIVGTGIFLTCGTLFLQFRKFGYAMRETIGKALTSRKKKVADKGAISPIQAVTTALAATVGTGNIGGVAGAIALGGPGAVFWMWISALFGMVTKYAEVLLAIKYRERNDKGEWVGGPMYYIKNGLGKNWRWLGALFCVLAVLASFGIGNMTQANAIAEAVNTAVNNAAASSALNIIVGITVATFVGLVIFGGVKRIGEVTEKLVPLMAVIYIVGALAVILTHAQNIIPAFAAIFKGAFNPQAIAGGLAGVGIREAMKRGVGRGVFSNEAGMGSAPIAHASADTDSPVRQGLFGIFEVFADTLVICTLTALTILCSGIVIPYGESVAASLTISAFSATFGGTAGSVIVTVGLSLFAVSTIISWSLYGSRCMEYLFGTKAAFGYKVVFVVFIVMGATMRLDLAWNIADTLNALMAIPNLIALIALSGVVFKSTREFFAKK